MRSILLGLGCFSAAIVIGPADAKPPQHPPDPHAAYQPRPGPYVVFFDEGDTAMSDGAGQILDNALNGWRPPHYARFVLCYDSGREGWIGNRLKTDRMEAVKRQLLARGAVQVLFSDWDCFHREDPLPSDRARMAILGVYDFEAPE